MRITLDLDDDIYCALVERARKEGCSPGHVLSLVARQALTLAPDEPDSFFVFSHFAAAVDR